MIPGECVRVAVRVSGAQSPNEKVVSVPNSHQINVNYKQTQKSYSFNAAFSPTTSQTELFGCVCEPLVDSFLKGYDATIFAYGQTGTGKTYTIIGTLPCTVNLEPGAGLLPRLLHKTFAHLYANNLDFALAFKCVELYNEEMFDLQDGPLGADDPVRQISKATTTYVSNLESALDLVQKSSSKRHVASTNLNAESSRSHTLFQVILTVDSKYTSTLSVVDLAGSENVAKAGSKGDRARETGQINQSLLALGRVVKALASGAGHVPYRDSKLTRVLQSSLGGQTCTLIIATVNADAENIEETMRTLEYTVLAGNVRNQRQTPNQPNRKALLELTKEVESLQRQLKSQRNKDGVYLDQEAYESLSSASSKVETLENQLAQAEERQKLDAVYTAQVKEQLKVAQCAVIESSQCLKAETAKYNQRLDEASQTAIAAADMLGSAKNEFESVFLRASESIRAIQMVDVPRLEGNIEHPRLKGIVDQLKMSYSDLRSKTESSLKRANAMVSEIEALRCKEQDAHRRLVMTSKALETRWHEYVADLDQRAKKEVLTCVEENQELRKVVKNSLDSAVSDALAKISTYVDTHHLQRADRVLGLVKPPTTQIKGPEAHKEAPAPFNDLKSALAAANNTVAHAAPQESLAALEMVHLGLGASLESFAKYDAGVASAFKRVKQGLGLLAGELQHAQGGLAMENRVSVCAKDLEELGKRLSLDPRPEPRGPLTQVSTNVASGARKRVRRS